MDSERFEKLFSQESIAGFISPGFNWDVLNYGRLINNVRVQDARFQELAYLYQQTVLLANAEVESAINNFLNAQERLNAAEEAVAASQRSVEIVELQYREGVADFNRVYNLQRLLVQDQDRFAATQGEVALFLIAAYKAIGGGWEIRNGIRPGAAVADRPPNRHPPQPKPALRPPTNRASTAPTAAPHRKHAGTRNQVVDRRQSAGPPQDRTDDHGKLKFAALALLRRRLRPPPSAIDLCMLLACRQCWPACIRQTCCDDYCPKPCRACRNSVVSAATTTRRNANRVRPVSAVSGAMTIAPSASR